MFDTGWLHRIATIASVHRDALLYLAPAFLLALLFRALARRAPVFLVFYLAGTVMHELSHLLAALLTNARPVSMSIFPRKGGGSNGWVLGSVSCANIRWYNGIFVGLAPLAVAFVPVAVATWRTRHGLSWEWRDAWIAALLAPQFMSCWPSGADFKIVLRSWPLLVAAAAAVWLLAARSLS